MTEVAPNTATPTKMVAMELHRHYVPMGEYEIVGHTRPAKSVKNAAGEDIEVVAEKFIEGEMYPSVYGGVGFANKIWAGTVIRVPLGEAERMKKLGIAERGLHD